MSGLNTKFTTKYKLYQTVYYIHDNNVEFSQVDSISIKKTGDSEVITYVLVSGLELEEQKVYPNEESLKTYLMGMNVTIEGVGHEFKSRYSVDSYVYMMVDDYPSKGNVQEIDITITKGDEPEIDINYICTTEKSKKTYTKSQVECADSLEKLVNKLFS
ncbi:MAG: hypothetical protein NC548_21245 [Lachnospiraceae bacterium]|nr:hypothetical protein [Lachnospiraceae bacterium]